jgi:ferritin-like metal-binding protein YciE
MLQLDLSLGLVLRSYSVFVLLLRHAIGNAAPGTTIMRSHDQNLLRISSMILRSPRNPGILSEAKDIIIDCGDAQVCDAAMLSAAQAVEHYEVTRYGTLIAFARQPGRDDRASVLQQTLEEERAADKKLTTIADSRVNKMAA